MVAVLFDLDGVLYEGEQAVRGAPEAIVFFQRRKIPHLFLTNTTSRPRKALVEKLANIKIFIDGAQIFTPPVAALQWIKANVSGAVALFVPKATREEFTGLPIVNEQAESGAGAVVVGDLGEGWDYATLNRAFRLLMAVPRPPLIALGMTRYWRAADGLRLDVAPFVVGLEHATGAKPVVLGKPAATFYRSALELLQVNAGDAVMIGDDIRGDIDGSQKVGMRGVLVRTGKFQLGDFELGITPHTVLNSVAELPQWWEANIGQT